MGRDVADTALLLSAMASAGSRDPMANPLLHDASALTLHRPVDLASLRVATTVDLGFAPVAPSIRRVFLARMEALAPALARCEAEDPDMAGIDRAYRVIRCTNFLAAFRRYYERDPALRGANTRSNYEEGLRYSFTDLAAAQAEQTRVYRAFQEFFTRHDLLLLPCQALTPFPKMQPFPTTMEAISLAGYRDTSGVTYGISMMGQHTRHTGKGRQIL
jgi:Asp-tRNA(Asn)/Glu-tRNA(Gln) amidotransferase A subunit family amidase